MKTINYTETDTYRKCLKKLKKRFITLEKDIDNFKQYVLEIYFNQNIITDAFVKIEGCCNEKYDAYKVKKFACRSLKAKGSRSGIRLIFLVDKRIIDSISITFVEIYYKGDREMNDMELLRLELLK